jgi:hypothetical protein
MTGALPTIDPQIESVAQDLFESERPAGRRASPAAEERASPGVPCDASPAVPARANTGATGIEPVSLLIRT